MTKEQRLYLLKLLAEWKWKKNAAVVFPNFIIDPKYKNKSDKEKEVKKLEVKIDKFINKLR